MDLMTLAAKIELDDSSYVKGIGRAEKMGQQMAGKMSAMTVAVGNLAADVLRKGINAIQGVISGAVDGYADYQQLVGGVETLFKSSATKVQKYAKESFKTTGLSANQYMETVTSFSASLLQGLGGDTEKAAEMSNMAIQDMADNANKMGTDITAIQNAYQGFAKQNYTMLDNLKLGYGGTATEMVRLINDSKILDHEIKSLDGITFDQIVEALHVVQDEMGITGTTAKEAADTISGSKASLSAAWQDLLVAVTGTDQSKTNWWNDPLNDSIKNFQESFSTYIENIVPALVQTIGNSGTLVSAIADAIADLPVELLSQVGEAGLEAGTDMVNAASKITNWIIKSISNMFSTAAANPSDVAEFGEAIGNFLATAITDIVKYAPKIAENIVSIGVELAGGLAEGLFKGLFGEGAEVDKITEQLEDDLTDINFENAQATALLRYLEKLNEKYGASVKFTDEWREAQAKLEEVLPAAGKVFDDYGANVQGAIDKLNTINESMKRTAIIAGIQKATHEMNELYGEQIGKAEMARVAVDIAKQEKIAYQQAMEDSVKAYAQRYVDTNAWKANPEDQASYDEFTAAYVQVAQGILNGTKSITGALGDTALMRMLTSGVGTDFWLQNGYFSPDQLLDFEAHLREFDQTIKDKEKEAKDYDAEAQKTWDQIAIAEVALDSAIQRQTQSYESATTGVQTGGEDVQAALESVAGKISSVNFGGGLGGLFSQFFMPRAVGIDYVPTDGFKTELHRGEAVLTRAENERYRNGGGNADVVGAIQGMRNDLQNLRLVVGQKTFGRAVVDYGGRRVNDYIGEAESRSAAGYGA